MKLNTEFLENAFRDNVRTLANYLYVLRGCKKGHDVENWLEAKKQLEAYVNSDNKKSKDQHLSN